MAVQRCRSCRVIGVNVVVVVVVALAIGLCRYFLVFPSASLAPLHRLCFTSKSQINRLLRVILHHLIHHVPLPHLLAFPMVRLRLALRLLQRPMLPPCRLLLFPAFICPARQPPRLCLRRLVGLDGSHVHGGVLHHSPTYSHLGRGSGIGLFGGGACVGGLGETGGAFLAGVSQDGMLILSRSIPNLPSSFHTLLTPAVCHLPSPLASRYY